MLGREDHICAALRWHLYPPWLADREVVASLDLDDKVPLSCIAWVRLPHLSVGTQLVLRLEEGETPSQAEL